jgi:hypothetical protein
MSDLISREDVYKVLKKVSICEMPIYVFDKLWNGIRDLPSAERKGEWKNVGFLTAECSVCGTQFHELEYTNFCPNCGADMREEDIPIEYFESGGK